jgi:hypothetical protein
MFSPCEGCAHESLFVPFGPTVCNGSAVAECGGDVFAGVGQSVLEFAEDGFLKPAECS